MGFNILIAEDDEDIVGLLKLYLENAGHTTLRARDGVEALDVFSREKVDLAIVDIMMPRMNGYELIARIRETSNIPILILSAAHMDSDKVLGLNIGADDYMVKPFSPLEMTARVSALLRRFYHLGAGTSDDGKIVHGELTLDTRQLTVEKRGVPISLTATEYKLLALLLETPGKVFTRMQLYEEVNGEYYSSDDNTVMVHISNLRDKLEDDPKNPKYIKTVRGIGYRID